MAAALFAKGTVGTRCRIQPQHEVQNCLGLSMIELELEMLHSHWCQALGCEAQSKDSRRRLEGKFRHLTDPSNYLPPRHLGFLRHPNNIEAQKSA